MLKVFRFGKKEKQVVKPVEEVSVEEKQVYPELLVGNSKTAILFLQAGVNESCANYDPFGLCTVVDCLQCKNSVYRIAFDNDVCIETDDFDSRKSQSKEYLLEFEDCIDRDIFEYLVDQNSNYRITRVKDNVVLRYTREDFFNRFGHYPKTVNESKRNDANRSRLVLKK